MYGERRISAAQRTPCKTDTTSMYCNMIMAASLAGAGLSYIPAPAQLGSLAMYSRYHQRKAMCLVREQGFYTRGAHPTTTTRPQGIPTFNDPAHNHAGFVQVDYLDYARLVPPDSYQGYIAMRRGCERPTYPTAHGWPWSLRLKRAVGTFVFHNLIFNCSGCRVGMTRQPFFVRFIQYKPNNTKQL